MTSESVVHPDPTIEALAKQVMASLAHSVVAARADKRGKFPAASMNGIMAQTVEDGGPDRGHL